MLSDLGRIGSFQAGAELRRHNPYVRFPEYQVVITGQFVHLDSALRKWSPSQILREPGIRLDRGAEERHLSTPRPQLVIHCCHITDIVSTLYK